MEGNSQWPGQGQDKLRNRRQWGVRQVLTACPWASSLSLGLWETQAGGTGSSGSGAQCVHKSSKDCPAAQVQDPLVQRKGTAWGAGKLGSLVFPPVKGRVGPDPGVTGA